MSAIPPPLPATPLQWRSRVQQLIAELRRTELLPARGLLYSRQQDGHLHACVEGVLNDLAIQAGIPAHWEQFEVQDQDGNDATYWEARPDSRTEADESSNRALPDALLYHGFDMPDGVLSIDALDCDPAFIRETVNRRYGFAFGANSAASLNDRLAQQGINPLRATADILEHLMDRPLSGVWHPTINNWAQQGRLPRTTRP